MGRNESYFGENYIFNDYLYLYSYEYKYDYSIFLAYTNIVNIYSYVCVNKIIQLYKFKFKSAVKNAIK